jgi:hypothetical protein
MTELEQYTNIIKHREKSIKLNFWDIGRDLAYIKEKSLYKERYESFKAYVEGNFTFTPNHADKMIRVATEYGRQDLTVSIGLSKLYLLLQVPQEHREEILEMVEDKKITRNELQTQVKRFKSQAGEVRTKQDEEEKLGLLRQFDSMKQICDDVRVSWEKWISKAYKYDKDPDFIWRIESAKEYLKIIVNLKDFKP